MVGAFLLGEFQAADELFNQARNQLGGVFDATSYDVANALCGIAFWYQWLGACRAVSSQTLILLQA